MPSHEGLQRCLIIIKFCKLMQWYLCRYAASHGGISAAAGLLRVSLNNYSGSVWFCTSDIAGLTQGSGSGGDDSTVPAPSPIAPSHHAFSPPLPAPEYPLAFSMPPLPSGLRGPPGSRMQTQHWSQPRSRSNTGAKPAKICFMAPSQQFAKCNRALD